MLNQRHLVKDSTSTIWYYKQFFFIRKYDLSSNKQVATFDLSSVSLIKDNLTYEGSQPYDPKSYYTFISDAYAMNGYLYLLCSELRIGIREAFG